MNQPLNPFVNIFKAEGERQWERIIPLPGYTAMAVVVFSTQNSAMMSDHWKLSLEDSTFLKRFDGLLEDVNSIHSRRHDLPGGAC